jgi:hypothetical protein
MIDLKKLKKYVEFARKMGLSTLKVSPDGTVEFAIGEKPLSAYKKAKETITSESAENIPTDPNAMMPSDSDMLMWSSPAFEVITETRKEDVPRNNQ